MQCSLGNSALAVNVRNGSGWPASVLRNFWEA
jgi:hypothetical protein